MATLEESKARQQVMWSSGDYGKTAWITHPLGDLVWRAVDLRPGSKVLDAGCGTGHVALAAARRFCEATGIDYVPSLLETGRKRAAAEGLHVTFEEGDVENCPFPMKASTMCSPRSARCLHQIRKRPPKSYCASAGAAEPSGW